MFSGDLSMLFQSLIQRLREAFDHPIELIQIGVFFICYLIAWIFARQISLYLGKDVRKANVRIQYLLSPVNFAIMLKNVFLLLLIWFSQVLLQRFTIPTNLLHMTFNLVIAVVVIRFASFFIKNIFWSRFVYILCLVVIFLRLFNLWEPTILILDSMKMELGEISISVWGIFEAVIVFILLWATAGAVNRFISSWFLNSTELDYSDRTLLLRVIKSASIVAVILISLRAAGIHIAAIVVTGGAIGLGIGVGLQKIGSNLISGIMLLVSKPIRRGDVIAFEKSFSGAKWGWITDMGLNYVTVATRRGTVMHIPNEVFVTQKTENLSYNDNLLRISVSFGISYVSDLSKAKSIAILAVKDIDRILKAPEPQCLVTHYGESTINIQLRVWINDPINGINNIKDVVYIAVWDRFGANGIEIAYPQRDLHIKSAVPLETHSQKFKAN